MFQEGVKVLGAANIEIAQNFLSFVFGSMIAWRPIKISEW